MSDHIPADDRSVSAPPRDRSVLTVTLAQLREDCRLYNVAVGNYNTHLDNHRDRRDLDALPFRRPITAYESYTDAVDGDGDAIDALLTHLLDQGHLDSQLRRHPRTHPVHEEALSHLRIARERLVATLEDASVLRRESGDAPSN